MVLFLQQVSSSWADLFLAKIWRESINGRLKRASNNTDNLLLALPWWKDKDWRSRTSMYCASLLISSARVVLFFFLQKDSSNMCTSSFRMTFPKSSACSTNTFDKIRFSIDSQKIHFLFYIIFIITCRCRFNVHHSLLFANLIRLTQCLESRT